MIASRFWPRRKHFQSKSTVLSSKNRRANQKASTNNSTSVTTRGTIPEIAENDFNLNIPRYVDTFEPEPEIDVFAVQDEISVLEEQLDDVSQKLSCYLRELGYDRNPTK